MILKNKFDLKSGVSGDCCAVEKVLLEFKDKSISFEMGMYLSEEIHKSGGDALVKGAFKLSLDDVKPESLSSLRALIFESIKSQNGWQESQIVEEF